MKGRSSRAIGVGARERTDYAPERAEVTLAAGT